MKQHHQIINPADCSFIVREDLILRKDCSFQDILSLDPDGNVRDMGKGHTWIHLREVPIDDLLFYISIGFREEKLTLLSFSFRSPDEKQDSWDNWSETHELQQKERYDEWLTQQIGTTRKFSWGTAWASYDPRSAGSSMGIRYK